MLPAFTCWPAKRFVPRRWPLLSRPLRELPCPFLWAIELVPSLACGSLRAPRTRRLLRDVSSTSTARVSMCDQTVRQSRS
jgi:hypothetical protein